MIKVEHVTRSFAAARAVEDISFEVPRGEIVGFLGPNGAGKTTLMRLLATYLAPTHGRILVDGLDTFLHSLEARRRIGYLPENAPLYPEMRVDEYLSFRAKLKDIPRQKRRERLEEIKVLCGLKDLERGIIGRLSKGYHQRIALADSLLSRPELLILDEPMLGLDPNQIRAVRELIGTLGRRVTVVMATHSLAEAQALCQRIFIMHRGRIVASDSPDRLLDHLQENSIITLEIAAPADAFQERLRRVNGILNARMVEPSGNTPDRWLRWRIECQPGLDIRPLLSGIAAEQQWSLRELRRDPRALEDVFARLTAPEEWEARK